jgi:polyisoprenoid-binding protein YceI
MKSKWILLLWALLSGVGISAQSNFRLDQSSSYIVVKGTSSLHDWQMQATDYKADLMVVVEEGKATVAKVDFLCIAESLKSDNTMMDKKAYEALKTGNHRLISFKTNDKPTFPVIGQLASGTVPGELHVAGVKKPVLVTTKALFDKDGNIKVTGKTAIKMSDYGIKPPVALLGALKTGDDVSIEYNLVFNKHEGVAEVNR